MAGESIEDRASLVGRGDRTILSAASNITPSFSFPHCANAIAMFTQRGWSLPFVGSYFFLFRFYSLARHGKSDACLDSEVV